MYKDYFKDKVNLIEGAVIILPLIWFLITEINNQFTDYTLIINLNFLALLVTAVIFRDQSLRHMYFAFILILLTVIGNILGFNNFSSLSSSLALNLLIIGIFNMLVAAKTYG